MFWLGTLSSMEVIINNLWLTDIQSRSWSYLILKRKNCYSGASEALLPSFDDEHDYQKKGYVDPLIDKI
jgi:hypothetical protein